MSKLNFLVLNGPNLNLLGKREPEIYGETTLADIEALCQAQADEMGVSLVFFQSNHEGELIDAIQNTAGSCDGIVVNAGAYTHTSVAIHDALKACDAPFVEVHISNVYAREDFRHYSYLSAISSGVICGFGVDGYIFALERLINLAKS